MRDREEFLLQTRCGFLYSTLIFDAVKLLGSSVLWGREKKELIAALELRERKHHWVVKHLWVFEELCNLYHSLLFSPFFFVLVQR